MQLRDVQMYQGSCCHNPDCTNLHGPSEEQLKTFLCAGKAFGAIRMSMPVCCGILHACHTHDSSGHLV